MPGFLSESHPGFSKGLWRGLGSGGLAGRGRECLADQSPVGWTGLGLGLPFFWREKSLGRSVGLGRKIVGGLSLPAGSEKSVVEAKVVK